MSASDFSRAHQTILVVAIALAAVIGSAAGAIGAVVMTGAINASDVLTEGSFGEEGVDQTIVQLIEEESATISVVDHLAPSVVSVVIAKSFTDAPEDTFYEVGGGSGFFMSPDGYIVTNRHVVSDTDAVYTVVTNDGVELPATVVAEDVFLDIAILDVEGEGYPVAALGDSDRLRIGQTVIAIGNTLSEYRNTVTKGVVSGINRRVLAGDEFGSDEVIERAIQTDAAINPGNSGGPLINLLGEVVGVNTAVSYEGQSIGFAIPINEVKKIVDSVETYGRIVRPWLGVRYVSEEGGAMLVAGDDSRAEPAVIPGSPADAAGLQEGDVIRSVDGEPITEDRSLGRMISEFNPGDSIALQVVRGEEMFSISVVLAELQNTL